MQSRRVRFTTTAGLVNELVEARDDRSLSRVVARYSRVDVLVLDEVGYVPLSPAEAELLFQVLDERSERSAVVCTTNLPFGKAHTFERTCAKWRRKCMGSTETVGQGRAVRIGLARAAGPGRPSQPGS
jgi:DNA replication protein DnaC